METEENEMFDELKNISKVEPSSLIFSKIENKIREEKIKSVSTSKLMAASVILILFITSNILIVRNQSKQVNTPNQTELSNVFDIKTSNHLYHE